MKEDIYSPCSLSLLCLFIRGWALLVRGLMGGFRCALGIELMSEEGGRMDGLLGCGVGDVVPVL